MVDECAGIRDAVHSLTAAGVSLRGFAWAVAGESGVVGGKTDLRALGGDVPRQCRESWPDTDAQA